MAKKSFADTMQQVAQNSRDMNKKYPPPQIVTGPKTGLARKPSDQTGFAAKPYDKNKDVNLPIETASSEVKKRMKLGMK